MHSLALRARMRRVGNPSVSRSGRSFLHRLERTVLHRSDQVRKPRCQAWEIGVFARRGLGAGLTTEPRVIIPMIYSIRPSFERRRPQIDFDASAEAGGVDWEYV